MQKKINKRYSEIMIALTAVLSIGAVRDGIVKGISFVYNLIIDIIIKILYYFFMAIGNVMAKIMEKVKKLIKPSQMPDMKYLGGTNKIPDKNIAGKKPIIEILIQNNIFNTTLKIVIFLLIAYLVIKILRTYASSKKENVEYIEESEFIKKEKDKSEGYLKKLKNLLKPKSYIEYIRHYYKKFMKFSISKGIEIENNDTTKDINKKASSKYKSSSLENLREIYLKARYGNDECNIEDTKKMKNYYQSIEKQK